MCVCLHVCAQLCSNPVCVCVCVFFQGDGREEVVACAWDGQTYIIDHNRTVVRFQFDENVNAFCAGEGHHTASSLFLLRRRFSVTVTTLVKFSANATTRHRNFPTVDLNLQLCPTYNASFSSLLNVTHIKTSRWGVFGFHVNSHISSVLMVSLRQRE